MLDIRWIRENPDALDNALIRRGGESCADLVLAVDREHRLVVTQLQELQTVRNDTSKKIGALKREGGDVQDLLDGISSIKAKMEKLEEDERRLEASLREILLDIPNLLHVDVPEGLDEDANVELRRWGTPPSFPFTAKDHADLGEALGLMDFETATHMSGSRFVFLTGPLAGLERALAQFMLDTHTQENNYKEVNPPLLVREAALVGTGQLPKFSQEQYKTTEDLWLIPTAEVSLTNFAADKILRGEDLPLRFTACTPCFRAEAGAAGRDTRGMIRHHQFEKVELVSIIVPEDSEAELERMTGCAEQILQKLSLPYRVMSLCAGDLGFASHRTYDLEVWLPGQNAYREISSCSATLDFQARRMNARFRPLGKQKGTRYVHTLNGSGLAVGRCLVAVMENYQQADGSIDIPTVLRRYMNGLQKIPPP